MDSADYLVINDSLLFCHFIEGGFAEKTIMFGSHSCFFVSPSSVCFDFSEFGLLGHLGAQIEFSMFVGFYFSDFVWLGHIGDRLEFSGCVFFFGFIGRSSDQICRAFFYVFLHVSRVFCFIFILSLSHSSELEPCWDIDFL